MMCALDDSVAPHLGVILSLAEAEAEPMLVAPVVMLDSAEGQVATGTTMVLSYDTAKHTDATCG